MVSRYRFLTIPDLMNNFIFKSDFKMARKSKMATKIDDFRRKKSVKIHILKICFIEVK